MSFKLSSSDLSLLTAHGYNFGAKVNKNSLSKVKHGDNLLACKTKRKLLVNDQDKILEILKKLSHPHIIHIHSVVQNNDKTFVFMKWIDDGNLLQHIKRNGMIKESTANLWFYQMVCAVKYLHDMGYAHCNLSCENVMVSKANVVITGLNHIQQCSSELRIMKKDHTPIPAYYLAPEINKKSPADARKCDVYALGVILFMMLNAKLPFDYSTMSQLIVAQTHRQFKLRPSNINILSIKCQAMLFTLMEPNDEIRWSINEMAFKVCS